MKLLLPALLLLLLLSLPARAHEGLLDAAEAGNVAEVTRLLDAGVPVDATDDEGETALIEAAEAGHTEVVRLLLQRGASVNRADHDGETALIEASEEGRTEVVRLLLDQPFLQLDAVDVNGRTALATAAAEGHADVVSLLLGRGAAVGTADRWGRTALQLSEDPAIQAMLKARGAR